MSRETIILMLVCMVIVLGTYVTSLLMIRRVFVSRTEATIASSGWQYEQSKHTTKLTRNKEGEAVCMLNC